MIKTTRLDKYLANLGYASRRKIGEFLQKNRLEINGVRTVEPGERFDPSQDKLSINGRSISQDKLVYYLVNKPKGYVTSVVAEAGHKSVLELLGKIDERVFPVGRLDVDSHGLVLLTNDGQLTYRLTHPKFQVPKTYQVKVEGRVNHKQLTLLKTGVRLKDGKTAPAQVKIVSKSETSTTLQITITEWRNRQIRRMCKGINLNLLDLKRIEFAGIKLGELKPGEFRPVDPSDFETV